MNKFFSAVLCSAFVLAVSGCSRKAAEPQPAVEEPVAAEPEVQPAEQEAAEPVDPVKERMQDAKYVNELHKRLQGRKDLMKKVGSAKIELEKAKNEGADAETLARLDKVLKEALGELKRYEQESRAMVGARMQEQNAAGTGSN